MCIRDRSKALRISARSVANEVLSFEFQDGKDEDVDRDWVLPTDSEVKLVEPQQSSQGPVVPESATPDKERHRIDAFFAKRVDDGKIDVHAEGQLMMRLIQDAGGVWDCNVNPQPTLDDLFSSIARARPNNTRGMHLAGHSRKECGFIWNANNQASASKEFDLSLIHI